MAIRRVSGTGLRRAPIFASGAVGAGLLVSIAHFWGRGDGQPPKYMSGAQWKSFLCPGNKGTQCDHLSWYSRWDAMMQPRIDQLAAIAENEGRKTGATEPYRVTMVGDSTMMQQHGVVCSFLAERPGSRFDPVEHQEDCCVDTLPRGVDENRRLPAPATASAAPSSSAAPNLSVDTPAGGGGGGRGLCFRHAFQKYAEPPEEEILGSPDVVYFGTGLHFLHMCRPGHGLEPPRLHGWLTYEIDLENTVKFYRDQGSRVIFMTSHTIEESKYSGEFKDLLQAYGSNDLSTISVCEEQARRLAKNVSGPEGYGVDAYCRQALLDRKGSDILNRRSRPVMARLEVPLVEGDIIVRDQAWATSKQDGRHYHMLVPVEIWDLFGVIVSQYPNENSTTPVHT